MSESIRRQFTEKKHTISARQQEALAKLSVYEKMDTKEDANTIKSMVGQLITMIGKQTVSVIK